MDFDYKNISLFIYSMDEDGSIGDFTTTNVVQPRDNCICVKISKRENLQLEKLAIKFNGVIPFVEHKEPLLEVRETEFGLELVKEEEKAPIVE